jgi:membrane complex biogenesis BtpA family protein
MWLILSGMFHQMFGVDKPIIGMVHLLALPGSPRYDSKIGIDGNLEWAMNDARALQNGGVDALMFCNEFDVPYAKKVGPESVAAMTHLISRVIEKISLPHGVSVLFDFFATIAIAKATHADFTRVILTGAYAGDYGIMDTFGPELLRFRKSIDADHVKLFTNISGEFGASIASRPIEISAKGAVFVGLGDALIVQGPMTGMETDVEEIKRVKNAVQDVPVLAGTGVRVDNVSKIIVHADGAIVGTSLKVAGNTWNRVDEKRVKEFMDVVKKAR